MALIELSVKGSLVYLAMRQIELQEEILLHVTGVECTTSGTESPGLFQESLYNPASSLPSSKGIFKEGAYIICNRQEVAVNRTIQRNYFINLRTKIKLY